MKKAGIILLALGLIAVSATILVDWLSSDGKKGFGAFQFFGLEAGITLLLVGLGWLIIKQDEKISLRRCIGLLLEKPLTWPSVVWTLLTFLALYIPWFLFPLFFSKSQIHYFTKYIPDAYITHIGFDIEAIVSRTQAWLLTGQSPYADGFIAYPPLAIALFVPFILLGYPAYFEFMTVLTFAAYLVASLVIPLLIVPKRSQALVVSFYYSLQACFLMVCNSSKSEGNST